jgi:hypothetical protein
LVVAVKSGPEKITLKERAPSSTESWLPLETSTYQDHVIKHVLGATVLGWFVIGDALHVLLDVGLLWTIYVNAEMSLMAQHVAIEDLESDELKRVEVSLLISDAQRLISEGREATDLERFTAAPVECTIIAVEVYAAGSQRRIVAAGETADIVVGTSLETVRFDIDAKPHSLNA